MATVMLLTAACVERAAAQLNVTGQWSVLPYTMPINPIDVVLIRTGKIPIVSGSQNDPTVTTNSAEGPTACDGWRRLGYPLER